MSAVYSSIETVVVAEAVLFFLVSFVLFSFSRVLASF